MHQINADLIFIVVKCSPKFTFSYLCTEWGTQKKNLLFVQFWLAV